LRPIAPTPNYPPVPARREGKSVSSLNNYKLGLASRTFALLATEDQQEFEDYTRSLLNHYKPQSVIEKTLVFKIAQHRWLSQRAFVAEQICWSEEAIDLRSDDEERRLTLYLRYQSHHDRAFHKCIRELDRIQSARRKEQQVAAKTAAPKHPAVAKIVAADPAQTAAAPPPASQRPNAPADPGQSAVKSSVPINQAA
jgi:hypothetical protein